VSLRTPSVARGDRVTVQAPRMPHHRGVDEARPDPLTGARRPERHNREADEHGFIVNLANVVSVRVSKTDSATAGQYL
jgi:hypothetical protein